jgi:hypothetical protein
MRIIQDVYDGAIEDLRATLDEQGIGPEDEWDMLALDAAGRTAYCTALGAFVQLRAADDAVAIGDLDAAFMIALADDLFPVDATVAAV